ncbi:MAG: hypothetical protein JO264_09000 [Acidisphaera sp.]|nr:hypothetical protein [Acidisphaera sp.]
MTGCPPCFQRAQSPPASADTYIVPALIADAGNAAGWRHVEFFTVNIRNPNTRRAYARACPTFFAWCEVSSGLQFSLKVGFENSLINVPFRSFRRG